MHRVRGILFLRSDAPPNDRLAQLLGLILLLLASVVPCEASQALLYQDRGDRHEGIRGAPRSAGPGEVRLVSARVDYPEAVGKLPSMLKIRFFLESPPPGVKVTVRELKPEHYYWLDRVRPLKPWAAGSGNAFEWSSDLVLRQLSGLRMGDLGVVVRLGSGDTPMREQVAPVLFYHTQPPKLVTGYLFTFTSSARARLTAQIYRGEKSVFKQVFQAQLGGVPFTVPWEADGAPAGPYRLTLTGYFLDTNQPIDQEVQFYHQPKLVP